MRKRPLKHYFFFFILVLAVESWILTSPAGASWFFALPLWSRQIYALSLALVSLLLFVLVRLNPAQRGVKGLNLVFYLNAGFLSLLLPPLITGLFFLFRSSLEWVLNSPGFVAADLLIGSPFASGQDLVPGITRYMGPFAASVAFLLIWYGILIGRLPLHIQHETLHLRLFPPSRGFFRIVHISDLHLGSFGRPRRMQVIVDRINAEHPDLILFTGDLVNESPRELEGWEEVLSRLEARYGKYAVLGNHDYGSAATRKSAEEQVEALRAFYSSLGFSLLLNENARIPVPGNSLAIAGVENWSLPPFPRYGKLGKALSGCHRDDLVILLSHDPVHWEEEVLEKTRIPLTLSGHTHGMQFGFRFGKVRWSPVQYRCKHWGGLYLKDGQYLNVNRGLGHHGYPGRIGMPAEISVLDLFPAETGEKKEENRRSA